MARNGSGTYNLPAGNPVVTGTTISSTTTNNTFNDIATALTGSISKDGQTTPTGNLPMGGFAHTGVADATVRTQYGTAGQIQDSAFTYLTSPAGTNAMTATASLGMSAYVTGQRFFFVAPATNTGACTLNINAIGVKSVTKNGTTALTAGDITNGAVTQVVYDGTQFQLLNPASVAANVSSFSAGSTGLTPSTATTGAVTLAGTLAVANGGTGLTSPSTNGNVLTSNGTVWISATPSYVPVGTIITYAGTTPPTGFLTCPVSSTNISRTTYASLFAAIGTTWGVGDGSTTFGLPWFAADYAAIQANSNVGTASVGQVISHTHSTTTSSFTGQFNGSSFGNGAISTASTTGATGGSANLAAGVRLLYCVKF
jgi:hypothetical protein